MRERGLKLKLNLVSPDTVFVAPYAGAWIEISLNPFVFAKILVAPYAGAWIEMAYWVKG